MRILLLCLIYMQVQLPIHLTEKICLNVCLSFQQKNFVMVTQQEIKQIFSDLTGFI